MVARLHDDVSVKTATLVAMSGTVGQDVTSV